jgi:hypothetical protein
MPGASHNFALLFSQRSEPKFGLFRHFTACPALLHITVGVDSLVRLLVR